MKRVLSRHKNIAFQYSGGKDSTAALLVMQPYWEFFTVYHGNTGDENPEITRMVDMVRDWGLKVEVVQCDVLEDKKVNGLPADIVSWSSAPMAHHCNTGFTPLLQDRVSCCFHNLMGPLHRRMLDDGITLIIRGQKLGDKFKGVLESGSVHEGVEYLYPIQHLLDSQVLDMLAEANVELPAYYAEGLIHIGDCIGCTAWNEERRPAYIQRHFPDRVEQYNAEMRIVHYSMLDALSGMMRNFRALK